MTSCSHLTLRTIAFIVVAVGVFIISVEIDPVHAEAASAVSPIAMGIGQKAPDTPSMMSTSARMIGGLFLCLGVFALVVRLLKRQTVHRSSGRRRIEIRERISLSSKASLTLIAIDSREFLIASGSDPVTIVPTQALPRGLFDESLDEVADEAEVCNA